MRADVATGLVDDEVRSDCVQRRQVRHGSFRIQVHEPLCHLLCSATATFNTIPSISAHLSFPLPIPNSLAAKVNLRLEHLRDARWKRPPEITTLRQPKSSCESTAGASCSELIRLRLVQSSALMDAVLKCDGRSYKVNRTVFSCHSGFFKKCFAGDFKVTHFSYEQWLRKH